jgi:hypothetical protein
MTNTEFNTIKINLYCKLSSAWQSYLEHAKYSIKDCGQTKDKLILAGAMMHVLCKMCLDGSDKSYCLTDDEMCETSTFICSLLKTCNCG